VYVYICVICTCVGGRVVAFGACALFVVITRVLQVISLGNINLKSYIYAVLAVY